MFTCFSVNFKPEKNFLREFWFREEFYLKKMKITWNMLRETLFLKVILRKTWRLMKLNHNEINLLGSSSRFSMFSHFFYLKSLKIYLFFHQKNFIILLRLRQQRKLKLIQSHELLEMQDFQKLQIYQNIKSKREKERNSMPDI